MQLEAFFRILQMTITIYSVVSAYKNTDYSITKNYNETPSEACLRGVRQHARVACLAAAAQMYTQTL